MTFYTFADKGGQQVPANQLDSNFATLLAQTEAASSLIASHVADTNNPHNTTAVQVGAQPTSAILSALAGLTASADKLAYFTGVSSLALTDLASYSRDLLADADAATWRDDLDVYSTAEIDTALADKANTDLSNAKWLVRSDLQGGGNPLLPANTWYETVTAGNSGAGYYLGANAQGTYALGPDVHGAGGIVGTATYYMWDVLHDGANLSDNNGFFIGGQFRVNTDTAGWRGGRTALNATLTLNATPGASPGNQNYVGLNGQAAASVNLGGSSGAEQGALFPFATYMNVAAAATHVITVGNEMDFAIETGSAPLRIVGLTFGDLSTERGTQMDAFINFTASADQYGVGIGRTYGIAFTDFYGYDPTYSGSTLIGAKFFQNPSTKRDAAWGVDFTPYTFSGGFLKNGDWSVGNGITNLDLIPTTTVSLLTNASASGTDNALVIRPGGTNGRGSLSCPDGSDIMQWGHSGSGNYIGFFGATAVKQAITGALSSVTDTNAKAVLTSIVTGIATTGLMTNSTT